MFRVREVVFDENLEEVSYVIEGTEADFRVGESKINTIRRVLYAKDLKERRATINKYISYKSGELEFSKRVSKYVEKVYLLKDGRAVEVEKGIQGVARLKCKGKSGFEYSLNTFRVTVFGAVYDVNVYTLYRLLNWVAGYDCNFRLNPLACDSPINQGYHAFHRNFPYEYQWECVSLENSSPSFYYNDVEDYRDITAFVSFIRKLGGKFAVKSSFDNSVLSDSLEVVSLDEWEFAEPRVCYSLTKMVMYLSTERKLKVRLHDGKKVLPKEYEITIEGALPLVVDGIVVNADNLTVIMPNESAYNELVRKYKSLVLFSPLKTVEIGERGSVCCSVQFVGMSVMQSRQLYAKISPVQLWFLLEEKIRLQRKIVDIKRELTVTGQDKTISGLSEIEEKQLNDAGVDPITFRVRASVKLPSGSAGVLFRLQKSLAVPSDCDLQQSSVTLGNMNGSKQRRLQTNLVELKERLSCVEKIIWMLAYSHVRYHVRYFEIPLFRSSERWGLKFIGSGNSVDEKIFGEGSTVRKYSTEIDGLTVTLSNTLLEEEAHILLD